MHCEFTPEKDASDGLSDAFNKPLNASGKNDDKTTKNNRQKKQKKTKGVLIFKDISFALLSFLSYLCSQNREVRLWQKQKTAFYRNWTDWKADSRRYRP